MNFLHHFCGLTNLSTVVTEATTEQITEAVTEAAGTVAETAELTTEQVTEVVTEAITEAAAGGFRPEAFIENLKYMGAGMIGIFLVIGVIILTIVLLGKLTAPKKKSEEED